MCVSHCFCACVISASIYSPRALCMRPLDPLCLNAKIYTLIGRQGKYKGDRVQLECADCPVGTYSSSQGETACTVCPHGKRNFGGADSCLPCEGGTYLVSPSSVCLECAEGTYLNELGSACFSCRLRAMRSRCLPLPSVGIRFVLTRCAWQHWHGVRIRKALQDMQKMWARCKQGVEACRWLMHGEAGIHVLFSCTAFRISDCASPCPIVCCPRTIQSIAGQHVHGMSCGYKEPRVPEVR